jgi:hypothetical protein
MSPASQRAAKNEAVFREVNERIRDLSEPVVAQGQPMQAVCECSHPDCVEQVPIELHRYEAIRAESTWFLIVPSHLDPEIEQVVEGGDGYSVVEKKVAERFLIETDPRDGDRG